MVQSFVKRFFNQDWKDSVGNFDMFQQNFVSQMIENSLPGFRVKNWQPFTLALNDGELYDGFNYDADGNLKGSCQLLYGHFTFFQKNDSQYSYKFGYPTASGNKWVSDQLGKPGAGTERSSYYLFSLCSALSGANSDAGANECGVVFTGFKISCEFQPVTSAQAGPTLQLSRRTKSSSDHGTNEALDGTNNLQVLSAYYAKTDSEITVPDGQNSVTFSVDFSIPEDSEFPADMWTNADVLAKVGTIPDQSEGSFDIISFTRSSDGIGTFVIVYYFPAVPVSPEIRFYIYKPCTVQSLAIGNEITNLRVYSDLAAAVVADEVFTVDNATLEFSFDTFYLIAAAVTGTDNKLQVSIASVAELDKILKVSTDTGDYDEVVSSIGTIDVVPFDFDQADEILTATYPNEPV